MLYNTNVVMAPPRSPNIIFIEFDLKFHKHNDRLNKRAAGPGWPEPAQPGRARLGGRSNWPGLAARPSSTAARPGKRFGRRKPPKVQRSLRSR